MGREAYKQDVFQNFVKVFDEYCNNRVIEKLSFTIFKNRIL